MTYIEILRSHGVVQFDESLFDLVGYLNGLNVDPDYWRDAVLVGSADVRLRRELVGSEMPLQLDIIEPDEHDIRLSRTAIDCMPISGHSLLGLHDAFVFGGDLVKWLRFSDSGLEGIAQVARTLGRAIAEIQGGAGGADDYARFQTAVWAAQLLRTVGPGVLGGGHEDDPATMLGRALVSLGFPERDEVTAVRPLPVG